MLLAAVTVSLIFLYIWVRRSFPSYRSPLPPLVFSLPLVGSPFLLTRDPRKAIRKLWRRHGPVFRIHRGCDVIVFLNGAKVIKEVMKLHPWNLGSTKLPPNLIINQFVKGGHLSEGSRWAKQRAILISSTRALSRDPEGLLQLIMTQECRSLVKTLMSYCETRECRNKTTPYFPVAALARSIARMMYRIAYGAGKPIDLATVGRDRSKHRKLFSTFWTTEPSGSLFMVDQNPKDSGER